MTEKNHVFVMEWQKEMKERYEKENHSPTADVVGMGGYVLLLFATNEYP